jgi:DNA modification methylase
MNEVARIAELVSDPDFTLYAGDVRTVLAEIPDESVDCVATSPPFFGLRDYGVPGQIGLEATPEEWAAELVAVFAECRRVLAPHGTLWLEVGDSYDHGTRVDRKMRLTPSKNHGYWKNGPIRARVTGGDTKPKDLIGAPFVLAFALRDDGWWWRSINPWWKVNCLPESAKDRPTVAHSYVMQFTKKARYWYDRVAVQEPAEWDRWGGQWEPRKNEDTEARGSSFTKARSRQEIAEKFGQTRNLRSIWPIPTQGYPGAHYATWPEKLAEKLLLMSCPREVCTACGKPRERIVETTYGKSPVHGEGSVVGRHEASGQNNYDGAGMPRLAATDKTLGWTDCGCGVGFRAGVALDPFFGSGTTGVAARRLHRHIIGVELNEEYAQQAVTRMLRWWRSPPQPQRRDDNGQQSLLEAIA